MRATRRRGGTARTFAMLSASLISTFAVTRGAHAVGPQPAGAVTPQTVKVPDGPGSVRGLANDATVSSFTGQVSYQIPIELPGGPGGFAPKLALSYHGALGNGPLGLGWSLGQPAIRRSLRLGVPSYTSNDELEIVGLGGGTLVPIAGGQYRAEGQGNSLRGSSVDGGFELIDAAGTHYRFGTSSTSRLASGTQVATWYLERETDVAGHSIDYSYERRDGELYLTSISWGGPGVFHADLVYEDRSDVVVSWRTGFRVATGRRLSSVSLTAFGGTRRTVKLTYEQPSDSSFAVSRLATVHVEGPDGTSTPTTTLTYASASAGQVVVLGNTGGWNLGNGVTSFFDVDKDGAMDLIRIEPSGHRYRRNLGGHFGPEVAIGNAPALGMSSVRMLDLDGDSGAEMVTKSTTWRAYRLVNNSWTAADWPGSNTLDLQSVAIADLNGDNRMDVLASSGSGIQVWFGTANGFGPARTLPAISATDASIKPSTVQFPDLNGDGLADAVAVNNTGLVELLGRGDGTFERIGPVAYPWTVATDATQVRLADLNRDGILDLVRIGSSQVFWHRGRPNGTFSQQPMVLNRPPGADASTTVALADANGNGSTDIIWSSSGGMWALDLAGPTNAGLLVSIDNGLEKTQSFEYTASAQLAWNAEAAGSAWTERMPISIPITTTATLSFGSGDPDRTSELDVRDGIYDADERRFIGFSQSVQTFPGATAANTIQVVTHFHPGRGPDRVLRGQVLSTTTLDGQGTVFKQVDNTVVALSVQGLPNDARLKRAAVSQTQTTFSEPGAQSRTARTRFAFDAEGRQTEERRDGFVGANGAPDGDETVLSRAYAAEDTATGVRDVVCEERVLDGSDVEVSHVQRLFGDATSVAALCQSSRGWVREERSFLASENRWVTTKQTSYDTHGNPLVTLSGGVERTMGYDPNGLYPVQESTTPRAGEPLTWAAQWDNVAGTLKRIDSPTGVVNHFEYDGLGRITAASVNAAQAYRHYKYQLAGPRPYVETFVFDGDPSALAALPATWTPGSGWRHTVNVSNGAGEEILVAVQLEASKWVVQSLRERDQRGRVTRIASAFDYDNADVVSANAPMGTGMQTMVYDALDRVIDQTLPTGEHKHVTYQPDGLTTVADGLAPVSSRVDGQGRISHTERTVSGTIEAVDAVYDPAGRILQLALQGGQVTHTFQYDSLGRMIHASDPDAGPRDMEYDDGGRVTHGVNGAGEALLYTYDGAGRVKTIDGAGVATRYHYDVAREAGFGNTAGQLAWVEESTGTVDFGYDELGRRTSLRRTIADGTSNLVATEATQFAPSGLARSIDLGDGVALPLHYDAAGRLTSVEGVWTVESYNAAAMPMREQFGNGVIQRYGRDVANRATNIAVEAGGHALYDVAAAYHANGTIETLTDNDHVGLDHSAHFVFDTGARLTSATIGTGVAAYQFSYSYDGLQNLTRRANTSGPATLDMMSGNYSYRSDARRQLDKIVADSGAVVGSFAYDAAGRQVQHAGKTMHYDALSQLTSVDGIAGGNVAYRYGYDGERVSTRSATGQMTYWITPSVVVRGGERDHYVRVAGRLLAKITTGAPSLAQASAVAAVSLRNLGMAALAAAWGLCLIGVCVRTGGSRRLRAVFATNLGALVISNGCGSSATVNTAELAGPHVVYFHQTYAAGPQLTTTSAGALLEERRTESFGTAIDAFYDGAVHAVSYRRDPINELNKFTDEDTSWSYHGARWFAPDTAQWHSPDPPTAAPDAKFMSAPWKLNPYQYVDQNPIAYWDPDGCEPEDVWSAQVVQEMARTEQTVGVLLRGEGFAIFGSESNRATFRGMLLDTMAQSSTFRGVMSDIALDGNPKHAISAIVGRNLPWTFVDRYRTNAVDLDDLEHFPVVPDPAHPNEVTRGELITHFMQERRYVPNFLTSSDESLREAHQRASIVQNKFRAELGQPAGTPPDGQTGVNGEFERAHFRFSDGTSQVLELEHSQIVKDAKP